MIAGIIEDLEFAETHIPLKSKLPTDVGRLTKGAAQAMLARVALYIGTWNKFHGSGEYKSYLQIAKEASKRLIDSKEYSLYADYRNLFLLPGVVGDSTKRYCFDFWREILNIPVKLIIARMAWMRFFRTPSASVRKNGF